MTYQIQIGNKVAGQKLEGIEAQKLVMAYLKLMCEGTIQYEEITLITTHKRIVIQETTDYSLLIRFAAQNKIRIQQYRNTTNEENTIMENGKKI